MKQFSGRILLIVAAVFTVQFCFAWGTTGHRVIAEIAERHLSKHARKEIKKLIGE